jgi:hypothetical protein
MARPTGRRALAGPVRAGPARVGAAPADGAWAGRGAAPGQVVARAASGAASVGREGRAGTALPEALLVTGAREGPEASAARDPPAASGMRAEREGVAVRVRAAVPATGARAQPAVATRAVPVTGTRAEPGAPPRAARHRRSGPPLREEPGVDPPGVGGTGRGRGATARQLRGVTGPALARRETLGVVPTTGRCRARPAGLRPPAGISGRAGPVRRGRIGRAPATQASTAQAVASRDQAVPAPRLGAGRPRRVATKGPHREHGEVPAAPRTHRCGRAV